MDQATTTLLDDFVAYLSKELVTKDKKFHSLRIIKYTLHDIKVSVHFFLNGQVGELYFDLREIKDNKTHFGHLLGTALQQLEDFITKV